MNIAVIGSINMDLVAKVAKIPSRGETIIGNTLSNFPGGKGANQAVAISRLGGTVTMFGCVGDDQYGEQVMKNLSDESIDISFIKKVSNINTGIAIITVDNDDNSIVVLSGANNCVDIDYINSVKDEIIKHDMVVMQNEIPSDTINYVIDICNANNIDVVLNPAPARNISLDMVDKLSYIIPNEHEAKTIFGDRDIEDIMKLYPNKVIVTEGEKGVRYSNENSEIIHIPCRKSKVVDTTGAGDTFNGAFCAFLSTNLSKNKGLSERIMFANIAAGISTEKFGAQSGMPYLSQVIKELND